LVSPIAHMPARFRATRRTGAMPLAIRIVVALALPLVAALTVAGTYLGLEIIVGAAWVAFAMVGVLLANPVMGIVVMVSLYLLSAYPTLLQSLGFLTVQNLLGVGFVVSLAVYVLNTRDLSFLKVPQVAVFAVIGLLFLAATTHAPDAFPLLRPSRGKVFMLDKTADLAHDFVTRLAFLLFFLVFVRTRRDIRAAFLAYMLALYGAVPSALVNWLQGNLVLGFRAAASFGAGGNANKLSMICLMEMACWWFWALSNRGRSRRLVAAGAIAACLPVLLATGSRSGLLGAVVLGVLIQTGPRAFRVPARYVGMGVAASVLLVTTVIPAADWARMTHLMPTKAEDRGAASSNLMREDTILAGLHMIKDHPWLGVGLGNFREVSRQVYNDAFYRPPHNSYLWAASEGGVFVLGLYLFLLWITWRDLQVVTRLAHRDLEVGYIAAAIRIVYLLFCFFALFADLWQSPFTYILIGQIVAMRRYVERLPEPAGAAVRSARRSRYALAAPA